MPSTYLISSVGLEKRERSRAEQIRTHSCPQTQAWKAQSIPNSWYHFTENYCKDAQSLFSFLAVAELLPAPVPICFSWRVLTTSSEQDKHPLGQSELRRWKKQHYKWRRTFPSYYQLSLPKLWNHRALHLPQVVHRVLQVRPGTSLQLGARPPCCTQQPLWSKDIGICSHHALFYPVHWAQGVQHQAELAVELWGHLAAPEQQHPSAYVHETGQAAGK